MTLSELLYQVEKIKSHLSSTQIPLKMNNNDCDLQLNLKGKNGNYFVDVKLKRKPISVEEFKAIVNKRKYEKE